jgi:hypothetical protein
MVALVVWLVGACAGAAVPGRVAPTLAEIETLGFDCGDGIKDNVPSGLYQWSCIGTMDDEHTEILVDGNDEGVNQIDVVVLENGDPGVAGRLFDRLVETVPPFDTAPVLKDTITDWDGTEWSRAIGGVRISAFCAATQCSILVMPADGPLRPLPLP